MEEGVHYRMIKAESLHWGSLSYGEILYWVGGSNPGPSFFGAGGGVYAERKVYATILVTETVK